MLCNAQNSRRKTMLAVSYLLSTAVSNPVTTTRQHDRLAIVSIDLRQTACLHHCTDTQECLRDPKVGERGACGVYQNIYASAAVEKWSTRAGRSAEIYAYTTRTHFHRRSWTRRVAHIRSHGTHRCPWASRASLTWRLASLMVIRGSFVKKSSPQTRYSSKPFWGMNAHFLKIPAPNTLSMQAVQKLLFARHARGPTRGPYKVCDNLHSIARIQAEMPF